MERTILHDMKKPISRPFDGGAGSRHWLTGCIDPDETYGPHVIEHMLRSVGRFDDILDIGAGGGRDLSIAATVAPQSRLHAVECYPPNIERLSLRGIHVARIDIEQERLPYDDGCMDVVIANQVLEHIKEIFWVTHEATRVLRTGGHFIIGVPNVAAFHNRILLMLGRHPTQAKTCSAHVRCFSRHDLMRFFATCWPDGYRLDMFSGSQFYPFPGPIARKLATAMPTLAHSIFFMLRKTRDYDGSLASYPERVMLETNYRTTETPLKA